MPALSKIIIDTNIIIHLEDNKEIQREYAELSRLCSELGITIFIHEASYNDVARDSDVNRRRISLSKLEKYQKIHKTPVTTANKEAMFGLIKSPNDEVDTDLLVSLNYDLVDILVTQDKALKSRVANSTLEHRVLNVTDALSLLKTIISRMPVPYRDVEDKFCNQYVPDNPFFASLKLDYQDFETWYRSCMTKQRPCWVIGQGNSISGMIIYKSEDANILEDKTELLTLGVPGIKILKLCLFKIDETTRGEKLGEQLLKKAMDYAFRNQFDCLYLTVFPHHHLLIELIKKFGFQKANSKNGEDCYYKLSKPGSTRGISAFEYHRIYWPCISLVDCNAYFIPIKPDFHDRLFPEAAVPPPVQLDFFVPTDPKTPGNAIRKVYVCHATIKAMNPGSILLFYRSGDSALASIGVLEDYSVANNLEQLTELTGRRSVYSIDELNQMIAGKLSAKVVNFYYATDLNTKIPLIKLMSYGVLSGAPQSIGLLEKPKLAILLNSLLSNEDKEIFCD